MNFIYKKDNKLAGKDLKLDVLAFGAHPDDVELGCAGTLLKLSQQGYSTGIIDLTEGEMASRGTVEERYKESSEASKILGVKLRENLKIPDANILPNDANRDKIIEVVRKYRPSIVFAPYPEDRHPDHVHASNLITEGSFYAGLKKVLPQRFPDDNGYPPLIYKKQYVPPADMMQEKAK